MRYQNALEQDLRNHLHNDSNDPEEEDNLVHLILDAVSCGNKENAAAAAQLLAQGNGFIIPIREVNTNVYVDALPGRRRP